MTERAQGGPVPRGWLSRSGMPEGNEVIFQFEGKPLSADVLAGLRDEIVRRGSKPQRPGWLYRWLS